MSSRCDLVSQLEHAIEEAVHEHHTNAQAIGLGIHCRIQKIFWFGKNNLYTPTWHSLNTASSAIGRLAPFMPLKRESCWKMLKAGQLDKMRETWETFVQEYVSICEEGAWDRVTVLSKITECHKVSAPTRARMLE